MNGEYEVWIYEDSAAEAKPLSGFRAVNVEPIQAARLIRHPVENGHSVFDNKVIEPVTIRVRGFVKVGDQETTDAISELLNRRTYKMCKVLSKEALYTNLMLDKASHSEKPDMFNQFEYNLDFTEIRLPQDNRGSTASPDNAARQSCGRK